MKLKITLIILVILSYFGGISSAITFYTKENNLKILFTIIGIIIVNLLCAKYLYRKTNKWKTEWALFGLLANINAIIIYWFYNLMTNKWKNKDALSK